MSTPPDDTTPRRILNTLISAENEPSCCGCEAGDASPITPPVLSPATDAERLAVDEMMREEGHPVDRPPVSIVPQIVSSLAKVQSLAEEIRAENVNLHTLIGRASGRPDFDATKEAILDTATLRQLGAIGHLLTTEIGRHGELSAMLSAAFLSHGGKGRTPHALTSAVAAGQAAVAVTCPCGVCSFCELRNETTDPEAVIRRTLAQDIEPSGLVDGSGAPISRAGPRGLRRRGIA